MYRNDILFRFVLCFVLCGASAAAQTVCSSRAGHLICGPGLQCFMATTSVGPVPHCMPPGSRLCGDTVCSPSQICLSRVTSGKVNSFCALPGETVCGTGVCSANDECAPSGGGLVCVPKASKACGPYLRCPASQICLSALNAAAHQTMYHCAAPGSTTCGPSFVCDPGSRCTSTKNGNETFYR